MAAGLGIVDVEIGQLRRAAAEARRQLRELRLLVGVERARVADEAQRGVVEVPRRPGGFVRRGRRRDSDEVEAGPHFVAGCTGARDAVLPAGVLLLPIAAVSDAFVGRASRLQLFAPMMPRIRTHVFASPFFCMHPVFANSAS